MKYLVIAANQKSELGDQFCVFWKGAEEKDGFTSNTKHAYRFSQEELPTEKLRQIGAFAIPCYALRVEEEIKNKNDNMFETVELTTAMELLRDLP